MRISLRLLLVVAALVSLAVVHAIEVSSEIRHSTPSSAQTDGLGVSRSHCSEVCSNENVACNEECAFNSEVEELEWTCRSQCTHITTNCLQACVSDVKPAPVHKHKPAPPRPSSANTGYGPEKVLNWAGYITVNSSIPNVHRHLWYWAFESRNNPATDPLVIWLTGGPGCSSLVALFAENGPYIIQDDLSLTLNPYSWNNNATVIWIDQPTRTGYSYSDSEDPGVFSENEVAENLYEFIQSFNQQYPKYANNPFIISGESYAGHYIPAFAYRVLQGNQDPTFPKVNLEAIAIGNGLVDPQVQYTQYLPFVVANKILSNFSIGVMQSGLAGCEAAIALCAQNSTLGLEACLGAYEVCNLSELMPYQLSGLNVYDFTQKCEIPPLCYNFSNVDAFLAQADVQQALGVVGRTWQDCNRLVDLELVFAGDWMLNLAPKVVDILASDIRVVVYSGEHDFICNWYGGFAWTTQLQWPGQQAFNSAQNNTWTLESGQIAGSSISADGLTFVRVANAGHMVPYNQPVAALDLITRVISGAPFDAHAPTARPSFMDETAAVVSDPIPAVAPTAEAPIKVDRIQLRESHATNAPIALY